MKKQTNFKWYFYPIVVLIVALIVNQVYFEMELIETMAMLIGKVRINAPLASIWETGRTMILYSAIIMTCIIAGSFCSTMVAAKYAQNLRSSIFRKVNNFSQEEIIKFSVPSLITRSTNDISQVQQTLQMGLRMAIVAPTMGAFSVVKILNKSAELSWVTGGAVGILLVLYCYLCYNIKK